jgi:hypothetical protein
MEVETKASGKTFDAGLPKELFSVPVDDQFDVGKDGRFLIRVPQVEPTNRVAINVFVNWQSLLKK